MSCREIRLKFSEALDAPRDAEERMRIESHCAACAICGPEWRTLLRLEERYDVRRVGSASEAAALREWRPNVALIDGTLLSGDARVHLGSPTLVLSGTEADGRVLLRRLPEGRGWLRKDATAAEGW